MKFIVDAQLPKSLSDFLITRGFDSIHTLALPNANATQDTEILELCVREDRIVITKDNDFLESYLLLGKPKQLIFVRTGNIRNSELLNLFERNIDSLISILNNYTLIEINKEEIISHS